MTYRLPTEPSRHRVAVWRELRRAGAVSLQPATWALPGGEPFDAALERAVALVERGGGSTLVFEVTAQDPNEAALETAFTSDREAEWTEFISECGKFEAELASEIAKEKFTMAELDEEEQNLDRLKRWHRELRGRDLFRAPSANVAEGRLKECEEALEDFADRVFRAREA